MSLLEELNQINDVLIHRVRDTKFRSYGRLLSGFSETKIDELLTYMDRHTAIPESGNCYVASVNELEQLSIFEDFQNVTYGGMPIQMGYCNGRNSTYNGFEYHKSSELNIAVTDFMLVLEHSYDIREDGFYDNADAEVFFVEKGDIIEMYQTTLHLSPIRVSEEGFKDVVVLPQGTNTPLKDRSSIGRNDVESKLLLQTNKWVIAHPMRKPLIDQGAFPGIIGLNKELYYPKEHK